MRLIDVDVLLNVMDERYKEKQDIVPDNLAEGFMQMEKLIKEQPIVNTWVPCSERLPEDIVKKSQITDSPYEDFEGTVKCPSCDKEFELEIETKCSYTTRKPSEQFNYEKWCESQE